MPRNKRGGWIPDAVARRLPGGSAPPQQTTFEPERPDPPGRGEHRDAATEDLAGFRRPGGNSKARGLRCWFGPFVLTSREMGKIARHLTRPERFRQGGGRKTFGKMARCGGAILSCTGHRPRGPQGVPMTWSRKHRADPRPAPTTRAGGLPGCHMEKIPPCVRGESVLGSSARSGERRMRQMVRTVCTVANLWWWEP